jgi:hypothetical protein
MYHAVYAPRVRGTVLTIVLAILQVCNYSNSIGSFIFDAEKMMIRWEETWLRVSGSTHLQVSHAGVKDRSTVSSWRDFTQFRHSIFGGRCVEFDVRGEGNGDGMIGLDKLLCSEASLIVLSFGIVRSRPDDSL